MLKILAVSILGCLIAFVGGTTSLTDTTWIAYDVTKWINLLLIDIQHPVARDELKYISKRGGSLFYSSDNASSMTEMTNTMEQLARTFSNTSGISLPAKKIIISVKYPGKEFWNKADAKTSLSYMSKVFSYFIFDLITPDCNNDMTNNEGVISNARLHLPPEFPAGVSFNADIVSKCEVYIRDNVKDAKFVLVTVPFSFGIDFPFHYGMFQRHMKALDQNLSSTFTAFRTSGSGHGYVNEINPRGNLTKYSSTNTPILAFRPQFKVPSELGQNEAEKYREILVQHGMLYDLVSADSNEARRHMVVESEKVFYYKDLKAQYFSSAVIPYMGHVSQRKFTKLMINYQLSQIGKHFDSLVIPFDDWMHILGCFASGEALTLSCNSSLTPTFTEKPKVMVNFTSSDQVSILFQNISFFQQWFGKPVNYLIFREDLPKIESRIKSSSQFFNQWSNQIKIGYWLFLGNLHDLTKTTANIPEQSKFAKSAHLIIWEFSINIEGIEDSDEYLINQIVLPLNIIHKARDEFINKYGKSSIIIKLRANNCHSLREDFHQSLYCSDESRITGKMNMMYKAIFNWAQVNDFTVILKAAIQTGKMTSPGWLYELDVHPKFLKGQGLILVTRGYNTSFSNYFTSDICITQNPQMHPGGIPLNNKIGATIEASIWNKTLTPPDLYILLKFASYRFQNVEIRISKDSLEDFKPVVDLLKAPFGKAPPYKVFIEFEVPNPSEPKFFEKFATFKDIVNALVNSTLQGSIHFSNWEVYRFDQFVLAQGAMLITHILRANINVGMDIQDCPKTMNFYANDKVQNYIELNYLVCTMEVPLNGIRNKTEMAQFFDEHLVLQKLLKIAWPNAQLVIRISHTSYSTDDPEKYLRMFNEVSEFASVSQISYFIPAFEISLKGKVAWWKVGNLKDASSYVETESEYLHLPTQRPLFSMDWFTLKNESAQWSILTVAIIATSVILGVALILIVGVGVYLGVKLRLSRRLLTKEEVDDFFNGSAIAAAESENPEGGRKFSREYSLPKSEFHLADFHKIIGRGNFGTVYKSIVKSKMSAVKIPNTATSKHSFKSMLMEVKILSYVGAHPNVVEFVGCYVDDIGSGVIYIATVFCENGSLEEYLRKKPRNEQVDERELTQFALGVATGMNYIAQKRIIHGDLSTRNVLLDGDNVCKIADFGLSRKLYDYTQYVKKSQEPLPWRWLAYESLAKMEFTSKSDVWSFGVTLWEIFSMGGLPYSGLSWSVDFTDKLKNGLRLSKPSHASDNIFTKMKECWNIEPKSRPDFENLRDFFCAIREMEYTLMQTNIPENIADVSFKCPFEETSF